MTKTNLILIGIAAYVAAVLVAKRIEVMEHLPDPFAHIEEVLSD